MIIKKYISFLKPLSVLAIVSIVAFSCSNSPSVERYIVENENTPGFNYTIIPSSILDISNVENPKKRGEKQVSLLEDIGSVYVLTFNEAFADSNVTREQKLNELKNTLPETKYKDLFSMNVGGDIATTVKFRGEKAVAKEIIMLFDNPKENQFIVTRVAGNIDLKKFVQVASTLDINDFSELRTFFEKGGMNYLEEKAGSEYNEHEEINF